MAGFIVLPRELNSDWKWADDMLTMYFFVKVVYKARYDDAELNGEIVERGSFVSSLSKMAREFGLSVQQVRTALSHITTNKLVTQTPTRCGTKITVCDYDRYQMSANGGQHSHQQENPTSPNKASNRVVSDIKDKDKKVDKRIKDKPLEFPFESEAFASVWAILIKQPKWKNKTQNALQLSLNKLGKYEEAFAIKLINDAIERGWQGVVFDDTPTAYQKWKDSQRSTQAQPMSARDIEWERTKRDGMKEEEEARERSRQKLLHDIAAGIIKLSTNETDGSLNL